MQNNANNNIQERLQVLHDYIQRTIDALNDLSSGTRQVAQGLNRNDNTVVAGSQGINHSSFVTVQTPWGVQQVQVPAQGVVQHGVVQHGVMQHGVMQQNPWNVQQQVQGLGHSQFVPQQHGFVQVPQLHTVIGQVQPHVGVGVGHQVGQVGQNGYVQVGGFNHSTFVPGQGWVNVQQVQPQYGWQVGMVPQQMVGQHMVGQQVVPQQVGYGVQVGGLNHSTFVPGQGWVTVQQVQPSQFGWQVGVPQHHQGVVPQQMVPQQMGWQQVGGLNHSSFGQNQLQNQVVQNQNQVVQQLQQQALQLQQQAQQLQNQGWQTVGGLSHSTFVPTVQQQLVPQQQLIQQQQQGVQGVQGVQVVGLQGQVGQVF